MVIQRDQPIRIWGWSNSGSQIKVFLHNDKYLAKAQEDGFWTITLPARGAGGPYTLKIKSGLRKIKKNDIYIGDVWLCSGQSNLR